MRSVTISLSSLPNTSAATRRGVTMATTRGAGAVQFNGVYPECGRTPDERLFVAATYCGSWGRSMEQAPSSEAVWTSGVHHIGLTVGKLEETAAFFTDQLGWKVVRRDPAYPAVFVSDGQVVVTLWQAQRPGEPVPFDRFRNVGLHHLALRLGSIDALRALHVRLTRAPGVRIEFGPEPLRGGPTMHMMCYEPSG